MEQQSYWSTFDNPRPRPIDIVADSVSPQQMSEFLNGCQAISILIDRAQPDVIFVPERGASPIMWPIDELLQTRGKDYPKIFLPIGTNTDPLSGKLEGFKSTEKKEIINLAIDRFKSSSGIEDIHSAVLIDEVQSGSTISTASKYIAQALPKSKFYVIAVQDDRKNILHRAKTPAFTMLATNERFGIQTSVVPVPLFNVDRVGLLDTIFRPSDAPESNQPEMLMVMHNTESEKMMRILALAIQYPHLLQGAISRIQSGEKDFGKPQTEQEEEIEQKIYDWINNLFQNNGDPTTIKRRQKRILFWLNRLASLGEHQSDSNNK